jgi:hypothetical protein
MTALHALAFVLGVFFGGVAVVVVVGAAVSRAVGRGLGW